MKHSNRSCKKHLKRMFADTIGCKPNQLRLGYFGRHVPTYLFSQTPNPNHCWVWYKGKCVFYNLPSLVKMCSMIFRLIPEKGCVVLHLEKKKSYAETDVLIPKITLPTPIKMFGGWDISELKIKFR